MSKQSAIEWTETTWNPVTGCTKISLGCRNCYAERMARRLQAMGQPNYRNGFETTCHPHALRAPLGWLKPQLIFVNSMSDLFHKEVPEAFVFHVFDVIRQASQHQFQILTKRAERLARMASDLRWPENVWMGVTVEAAEYTARIDHLRSVPAMVRFLSLEPLLGAVPELDLSGIDWVIVGGESGPGARPIREEWIWDVKRQCNQAGVAFFFKQWGGVNKKKAGRLLKGRTFDEMPTPVFAAVE